MELEKLMELYRKTTQEDWKRDSGDLISSRKTIASDFHRFDDAEFSAQIHNSFPAFFERLRVAEKMVELLLDYFQDFICEKFCPDLECSDLHKRNCFRKFIQQKALRELGQDPEQEASEK